VHCGIELQVSVNSVLLNLLRLYFYITGVRKTAHFKQKFSLGHPGSNFCLERDEIFSNTLYLNSVLLNFQFLQKHFQRHNANFALKNTTLCFRKAAKISSVF
jgi:hypothetical protein